MLRRSCLLVALLALACDGVTLPPDAGSTDAGPTGGPDAGAICDTPDDGAPRAVFDADGAFFDLPWPNDLRRQADGRLDMTGFPNPGGNTFVARYLDALEARMRGFGTNGSIYLRFSRTIDPATLPADPAASVADGSSVILIDVETGERRPVEVHVQDCPTRFWAAHSLAVRPVFGMPLASDRAYAVVVTRDVRTMEGEALERDAGFEAVMGGAEAEVYGVLDDALSAASIAPDDVLVATVFTTQDAVGEMLAIRDWMHESYDAPVVRPESLQLLSATPRMHAIEGTYGPVPIFQDGAVPYLDEGGAIELTDGVPTVHGEYDARFALSIPGSAMPEAGYPIVLYAHGTGGDYMSFRGDTADALAERGIAVMGVDQIHHGARNPSSSDPALLFFNIPNPDAARDNNRQSALDVVQQARLVANLDIPTEFVMRGGEAVRFDPDNVYFMGHSQGGLNGPIFLAIDDGARAAALSAASAIITPSLVEKVEPLVIPDIVKALLALPGGRWEVALAREGFTVEHPIATLIQTWIEVSDAANYAHLIVQSPREGFAPKSVVMTEGLLDEYSPPRSIEALAAAMFLPPIAPVASPLEAHVLRGTATVTPPVSGNLADGAVTAGLLQFPDDGHFAIYRNEIAATQVYDFLGSLTDGGPGTVPAP